MRAHSHDEKQTHPHADQGGAAATTKQLRGLALFFEAHFGEVELHMPETSIEEPEMGEDDNEPSLLVTVDDSIARINLASMVIQASYARYHILIGVSQTVTCANEVLRKRAEAVLDMAVTTVTSLSNAFTSGVALSGEENGNDKRLADVDGQPVEEHKRIISPEVVESNAQLDTGEQLGSDEGGDKMAVF